MPAITLPDPTRRPVAILGGGVLGRRIGCVWAAAGFDVHIRDPNETSRNDAIRYITQNVGADDYTKLTKDKRKPGTFKAFADLEDAVKNAFLIIEAVPEKLELKIGIMAELDAVAPKDCIIASNSSSYKSSLMIEKVSETRRKWILNAHYQMPPGNLAVELMTDGYTDQTIFPFLTKLHEDIGLLPATCRKESTGFILNRLWAAIKREILMIMAEGVSDPEQIDKMWKSMFKAQISPCTMMDQIGLDTVALIEENYIQERHLDPTLTTVWLRKNFIDQGKLGAKSSRGGLYPPGGIIQQTSELNGSNDDTTAPLLYVLDAGVGSNVLNLDDASHSGRVIAMSADGKTERELVTGLNLPDGIAVSIPTGRMFWTNMGSSLSTNTGSVMSADLDGKNTKIVIPEGDVHTPKQLTLDEEAQKIYFCDREGLRIHRCNYDGAEHEILVQTGNWKIDEEKKDQKLWCVGIAIDREHGSLYWTQKGASKASEGRIFRAGLEIPAGETAQTRSDIELLFENLPEPIDLDILSASQTLYWTDRGEHPFGNSLNKAMIGDKTRSRSILARHFNEAIGVKLDSANQYIYVTDLGGSIYRLDMDGKNNKQVYRGDGSFTGIDIVYVKH
jgi:3-hydroxyacyl-CoA dehydrogenase